METKWSDDKKAYQKEYHKKWYAENKERESRRIYKRRAEIGKWFKEIKSKLKCSTCQESHVGCLEFHHLDGSKKESVLSEMAGDGCSKKSILEEMKKCIVLCSNCHRKLHFDTRGLHKDHPAFQNEKSYEKADERQADERQAESSL